MYGKRQKLPTKRSRPSEDSTPTYDVTRFVNASAADRFGTICKNRSFIKEKGFHHPDDFFRKTIAAKGWRALCQPPHPAVMSVVREFYANLASHVLKKVRVHVPLERNRSIVITVWSMYLRSRSIGSTSTPTTPRLYAY